jgi:hypothetical protein
VTAYYPLALIDGTPTQFSSAYDIDLPTAFLLGGQIVHRTPIDDDYSIKSDEYYIGVTDASTTPVVSLPGASVTPAGKVFIVKDESGDASAHNITIKPNGSDTIDGVSTAVITKNYGCKWVLCDGVSNWSLISIVAEGGSVGAADPLIQLFAGKLLTSSVTGEYAGGGNFNPSRYTFTTLYFEASAWLSNSTATGTVDLIRMSDGVVVATLSWNGGTDDTQKTKSVSFTAPGSATEYSVWAYLDNKSEYIVLVNARLAAI